MLTPTLHLDGPTLLFGGPYSNLQATRALLAEAARLEIPPHRIICTGDVVAYGADPAPTLDLIIAAKIPVVMGNCEESLATSAPDCGCGFEDGTACALLARDWFAHANARVTPEHRAWMAALPRQLTLQINGRRLAVLHGGATTINRFLFPSTPDRDLLDEIAKTACEGVIAGHAGLPFTRQTGSAIWCNPGAIGMPANDGTPRAWHAILTPTHIHHRALHYDWPAAAAAMRAANLPSGYADALETGLWPSLDVLPNHERSQTGIPLQETSLAW